MKLKRPALASMAFFTALCAMCPNTSGAKAHVGKITSPQRNVVIFVADGLRHGSVNSREAPTLFQVRTDGVNFINSHSLFPTFTTANASAIATGHYLGDTGDFSNDIYIGFPIFDDGHFGKSAGTYIPFLENDQILSDLDDHSSDGNYLNEHTLLAMARAHGFSTAAVGKLGPAVIQDVTQVNSVDGQFPVPQTVIFDDATGSNSGVPLSNEIIAALNREALPLASPSRNQSAGTVVTPGTDHANVTQQRYFSDVTTKVILPLFKQRHKPFVIVFWSRDPDGTQHNQGDSLNTLSPGINGPTSKQAVRNVDSNLKQILDYIRSDPALARNTDIVITADHGFSTISKHEINAQGGYAHSYSTQFAYRDDKDAMEVKDGWLPPGFLAIDLAHALDLPLYDPDTQNADRTQFVLVDPAKSTTAISRQHSAFGNGLIGGTGKTLHVPDAQLAVAANGGSDLIYLLKPNPELLQRIVDFLNAQDYVDGLFVDDTQGQFPGALPLSRIGLQGASPLPHPTVVVNFKTFAVTLKNAPMNTVQVADSGLQEGQGMHGGFARGNTYNHMAVIGPDFKQHFVDPAPVSNADITPTLAYILGFDFDQHGALSGRVLKEALKNGPTYIQYERRILPSEANNSHQATILVYQVADHRQYFDAACLIDTTTVRAKRFNPCNQ